MENRRTFQVLYSYNLDVIKSRLSPFLKKCPLGSTRGMGNRVNNLTDGSGLRNEETFGLIPFGVCLLARPHLDRGS